MSTRFRLLHSAALLALTAAPLAAAPRPRVLKPLQQFQHPAGIESAGLNHDAIPGFALFGNPGATLQPALNPGKPAPRAAPAVSTITVLTITTPLTLYYGQIVDGFAQAQANDNSPLTGNITFYDGAANLCTIPVSASINCPASTGSGFVAGIHSLTAAYSGDSTHSASTSSVVNVTIVPDPVTATLTSSLNPAPLAQSVTLTATLTGNFAAPTGPVTFYDGATDLGTAILSSSGSTSDGTSSIATLTLSNLAAGTHAITAVYAATQNFSAVSATVSQVITPAAVTPPPPPPVAATTATTISSSANPAAAGQTVIFTAHVTNLSQPTTIPTGSVTFLDGNTSLGTFIVSNQGIASVALSNLTAGTHSITAVYAATQNFSPSSANVSQVITPPPPPVPIIATTATTLSSSTNPAAAGQTIIFTAHVANPSQPLTVPIGSVTFFEGPGTFGIATLGTATIDSSGSVSFTTSGLAPGSHTISASYAGNAAFSPSSSPELVQIINPAPVTGAVTFVIAVSSGSATVATGDTATILVSVSPVNGFDQAVQLTCANLPEQATCTFAAPIIAAGGGATTLKLLTLSPRACGSNIPYNQPGAFNQAGNYHPTSLGSLPYAAPIVAPILAGVLMLFLPKRRRTRLQSLTSLIALSLALTGLLTIAGCGACTNLGTRPGTYTLQITGTSTGSSPLTVSQSIRINVTP